ncbi:carboxyl-terminal protease [Formosa agariphila KMM 3901]|uniref:Carboxyl-terminal protease n=1 Tax=Formosa agariphila (strain DSM 15362 / KCTC 12365 / LMG 23005 / KMM 3901 / M-2Alg 35-1) TaxID=1347342 RepID=T2KK81_FORAG|nr:S41 family peptidase [Formosa agariphila]CDF78811.1 carboxyl-terminal protease [Formosa agariphila KMM 3901]
MQHFKTILFLFALLLCFTDCAKDLDDYPVTTTDINDFVWKGMNTFYLYKDEVPNLSDARFLSETEYQNYLSDYSKPEDLFYSLLYNTDTEDRFSWITDDYIALEQQFSGESSTHGMEYGLVRLRSDNTAVFGYVRYVLPGTDAEFKGLKRGAIFNRVDGELLYYNSETDTNIGLMSGSSYTIGMASYNNQGTETKDDDTVESRDETINLVKSAYTENPIYDQEILQVNGQKVGYLMYNGFTGTDAFDSELNAVFGTFKNEGISDLILDFRYNPGGSVSTATWLASMVTGQFTGDVFVKEQWNSDWQSYFENNSPEDLLNPFVDVMEKRNSSNSVTFSETINHLNLNKVYVITTGSTASASELIINGLTPYINVVQVGGVTVGKYQASRTVYDSPTYSKSEVNPTHTYAMQPLIFKSLNADGYTDYFNGLTPDIQISEDYGNLGVLGDVNEPLLAAALSDISGTARKTYTSESTPLEVLSDSKSLQPLPNAMYVD